MEEYPSLAEGIGLENRQAGQTARGFESLFLRHLKYLKTPAKMRVFDLIYIIHFYHQVVSMQHTT